MTLSSCLRYAHQMHFNLLALTCFATTWCHITPLAKRWLFHSHHAAALDSEGGSMRAPSSADFLSRTVWSSSPALHRELQAPESQQASVCVPRHQATVPVGHQVCSSPAEVAPRTWLARLAPHPEIKRQAAAAAEAVNGSASWVLILEGNAGAFRWVWRSLWKGRWLMISDSGKWHVTDRVFLPSVVHSSE